MSKLNRFLKKNKVEKKTVEYVATKDLVDDKGEPLKWTLKELTTREVDDIRDSCTIEVPVKGKMRQYRTKTDNSKLVAKLITASVVFPDLDNAELQDSYGVMGAENLIREMVDNPGEYVNFSEFVQELSGFNETLEDDIETAKN